MKKIIYTVLLLFMVLLTATACGILQEPAEPSATIEAVPLEVEESEESAVEEPTEAAEEPPVELDEEETDEEETMEEEAVAEEAAEEPTDETAAESSEASAAGVIVYEISQAESTVQFELDEDLRGVRTTVVGTTDQVAGQLALDLSDLSSAQIGEIQINARTLATDNNFRNRAIQNEILDTGEYEFISFVPTAVNGLPASAAVGEEISFTIDGDLTIRDITEPVTFTVVATAVSDTQISGTATATVLRDTYGLTIPEVPNVANVENEVDLIITFVANAS
ncbi:MAG: hypothetical protein CL608_09210 [Anaerolineaceae bacterium]|nr:hypothetical protein [Anaerolineaceae bacterium]